MKKKIIFFNIFFFLNSFGKLYIKGKFLKFTSLVKTSSCYLGCIVSPCDITIYLYFSISKIKNK